MTGAPIRLHIGGQERREGWTILDALKRPEVDIVGVCTDLSMLADGSVAEIYASHVFEHLGYQDELFRALGECHRVLVPGGMLRVSVPDLEVLCDFFLQARGNGEARLKIMQMMFGAQADAYDFHKVGLFWELLGGYLQKAGFRDIRRVEEHGLFRDTSVMRANGRFISLNVTALK